MKRDVVDGLCFVRLCALIMLHCQLLVPETAYNLYCVGLDVKHCSLTHSRQKQRSVKTVINACTLSVT